MWYQNNELNRWVISILLY